MPEVIVISGPSEGLSHKLGERCIVGRHAECDLCIDDDAISRRHALIKAEDDGYYVEDLGSSNGTFLNGTQTSRARLTDGDTIKMSHTVLAYRERVAERETQVTIVEGEPQRDSTILKPQDAVAALFSDTTAVTSIDQLQDLHDKLLTVSRFSKEVRSTLELNELLRKALGLLFEIFPQAERGFVMLKDETGNMRAVASKTVSAGDEIRVSSTVLNVSIREKKAILSNNPIEDERFSAGESIVQGRMRSLMVAPLLSQEEAIGVLHVDTTKPGAPFSTDDLALFSGLADQAAVAVSNAHMHERLLHRQRFEQELVIAQTVQRSFLPAHVPENPHVELAFHYALARQVGGDFYDLSELPDGRLVVIIGDVSGKGIPAALLMAKTSSEMRVATQPANCPSATLAAVNSMMLGSISAEMFVTALVCSYDPRTRGAVIADAGHNPPILKRASGKIEIIELHKGFPLGVVDDGQYSDVLVELAPGDTMLFYTDGLTDAEAETGEFFGMERLCGVVDASERGAANVVARLAESVREFTGLAHPFDDLTMVAIAPK